MITFVVPSYGARTRSPIPAVNIIIKAVAFVAVQRMLDEEIVE